MSKRTRRLQVARFVAVTSLLVGAVAYVTGCGYVGTRVPPDPPPAYDLDAVKARLADECRNLLIEPALCAEVKIDEMLGSEGTLWVPTTLVAPTSATGGPDPGLLSRLLAICEQFASARLGAYTTVIVVGDRHGNRGCEVGP